MNIKRRKTRFMVVLSVILSLKRLAQSCKAFSRPLLFLSSKQKQASLLQRLYTRQPFFVAKERKEIHLTRIARTPSCSSPTTAANYGGI